MHQFVIRCANLFGPPPPGVAALGWVGPAQWLLAAWGFWVDRHRRARAIPLLSGHASAA